MSYIYSDKLPQILDIIVTKGLTSKRAAEQIGLSSSRVCQILQIVKCVINREINKINKTLATKDDNYILRFCDIVDDNPITKYVRAEADLFVCYANSTSMEDFYNRLKKRQTRLVTKLYPEDIDTVREALFNGCLETVAREKNMSEAQLMNLVYLVCLKLNPKVMEPSQSKGFKWYCDHKDAYFQTMGPKQKPNKPVDLSNLKYIGLLKFLEKGDKPRSITPDGLEEFLKEQYPNIEINFGFNDRLGAEQYDFKITEIGDKTQLTVTSCRYTMNKLFPLTLTRDNNDGLWIDLYLRIFVLLA